MQNFRHLNNLILSGSKNIGLTSDVSLADDEELKFENGIELDSDNLVIDGHGRTIDANGKSRIFSITSGNVTLRNIVFKNAFSAEDGGAIRIDGGSLSVEGCRFIDNKSEAKGASIYCSINTKAVISNTQFINNRSDESGCIHNFNSRVEIIDSKFYDNLAESNASVIINQKRGRLLIKNSIFKDNHAQNGGAILNFGKCEIFNSLFKSNITSDDGGAINSQIRSLLNIKDTRFIENECGGDGGAVVNFSRADFNNVVFLRNSSQNHAGAISNQKKGSIRISNSTFSHNNVEMSGGAMVNWGRMSLENSRFENNISNEFGGAIFNQERSSLKVESCEFMSNSCRYSGGAIFNWGGANFSESSFESNASDFGGAINSAKKASTIVYNSIFSKNRSKNGGSIFNNSKHTKLVGCEFSNHNCSNAIYNFKSLMSVDTIFNRNSCENVVLNDEEGSFSCAGGQFKDNCVEKSLICNIGEFSSLSNIAFMDNVSSWDLGGDVYNEGYMVLFALKFNLSGKSILNRGILDAKKMDLSKIHNFNIINDFSKRSETESGFINLNMLINEKGSLKLDRDYCLEVWESDFYEGGIEIRTDGTEIDGCDHVIDGTYRSRIFIINARDVVLKNIIFKNGMFFNGFDRHAFGGGAIVVLKGASLKLENCLFHANRSNSNGGAISNDGHVRSINCRFIDNESENYGGAVYNRRVLTTENDEFKANKSRIAGAIYNREHLKIEKDIILQSNESQFTEAIYNAGLVEGSGFDDFIYGSSGISKKPNHESFTYLMDMIETSSEIMLDRDITFDYTKDFYLKYRLDIRNDLTIDGAGHIIEYNILDDDAHLLDGANSSSLFRILKKDVKVTFRNIVFKNCYSNGRDIIDNSAELTIENCRFINCRAIGDDCLINNSNVLKIKNSYFSNNMSSAQSLIRNSSKLEISDVRFINNNSQAIGSCIANSGEIDIADSLFKSNSAKNNAGCIYNEYKASIILSNVDFEDNDAEVDGGVFYNYGELDITDSRFANNMSHDEGGVINNRTSGEVRIVNSQFLSNESKTNGGAIFNYGKVNVEDSGFIENRAKNRSGAIEHTRPLDKRKSSYLKVSNTEFKANKASQYDDVYSYDGADVELR